MEAFKVFLKDLGKAAAVFLVGYLIAMLFDLGSNNQKHWSAVVAAILYVPAALAFLFFRKQKPKN